KQYRRDVLPRWSGVAEGCLKRRPGSKRNNCRSVVSYRTNKLALSSPGKALNQIPNPSLLPLASPPESKRSFKEKMAELVRTAREQGYLTRDEVHDLFADIWTKLGDETEALKQLHLLDIQIVESLDLLSKSEPETETEKHREAV